MAFIGKNVIENLTTAMYEDLRVIYREYVQNSADSIDKAVQEGIIRASEARIEITIDAGKRYIAIKDNGTGINSSDFERVMSSIADSTKDRTENKGFRGIGRLGGISSCGTLRFSCSAIGEDRFSVCTWDAAQVREILADKNQNPSASALVDKVTNYCYNASVVGEHYFWVELIDVETPFSELLNEKSVRDYLCTVAPIPYQTGFIFQSKIENFARNNSFTLDEYQIFINGERIYKPYSTKLYESLGNSKKAYDELSDVDFQIFQDNEGTPLAWMWYGVSKFEKQIPSVNPMRGIRLRKGNIQIGDENTFLNHGFYKENRGGLYFVGEVFAVSNGLIPNARRDYFNLNETCRLFEEKLRPLFYDRFYTIYHHANEYKKALQKQADLQKLEQDFAQKEESGGFIDAVEKKASKRKIEEQKKAAEEAARKIETRDRKASDDDVMARVFSDLRDSYASAPEKTSETSEESHKQPKYLSQTLSQYNKKEQKLIGRIYSLIQTILPYDTARLLIDKIQEELSR